ncbi:MAG: biotin/lipoyl-binding protein [Clostridia bacterium]|nr:biotin/lipoyl-binding protein [Deltaproteobacteria bacterium]
MHYVAIVNGVERQVEIVEVGPERYRFILDGRVIDVDARAINETNMSIVLDDHAYNIESERVADGSQNLLLRGEVVSVDVLDLRKSRLRKVQEGARSDGGPAEITSPMPGKVVAVLVKEGQEVTQGQGLIVVEAMKMENELRSPRAGIVRELKAKEGAAVDSGAALCTVE